MKKIAVFCASLALVLVVSGGAKAGIVSTFGTISVPGAPPALGGAPTTMGFEDDFTFQVMTDAFVVELSAVLGTQIDLSSFSVQVFKATSVLGNTPMGGAIATALVTGSPNQFQTAAFAVDAKPASYFVRVKGDSTGVGSNYSVQLTVSAVPIPPAAVLFLSALAGLAGFSRIRRQKAVTT